jgi:hypothetical protein
VVYAVASRPSYAAKVITAGVMVKAVLMATVVELLAIGGFGRSIILVLVSATATGIFGLIIVLVQTHAEAGLHQRLDSLERQVDQKASEINVTTETAAAQAAQSVVEQVTKP